MSSAKIILKHLRDFQKLLNLPAKTKLTARRFLPKQKVLIVSPHPDDEILMGALALRLQEENKFEVINVAVTVGSNPDRKKARVRELTQATKYLKWKNVLLSDAWSSKESELSTLITKLKPALIIAPHAQDRHPTHEQTAQLTIKSLKHYSGTVAWAEYWSPMKDPNVLLEISADQHLRQVTALECHVGEVERNPYHLRLMGWQMDTVRRGSEWLANKGAHAAPMLLAQLYRFERWENGKKSKKSFIPFLDLSKDATDWLA